ncbi:MAG: hypothetical protein ABUL49_01325 [bacterium]
MYTLIKLTLGVFFTVGLYSVLFKENKFYRFAEHVFLGLAGGYSLVALWSEVLYPQWWQKMVGIPAEGTSAEVPGYWLFGMLLPIGVMGYFVFSKKHNWISRVPIGIILGLWAGQQLQVWWTKYGPQINDSMRPMIPTTFSEGLRRPDLFTFGADGKKVPLAAEAAAHIRENLYPTQALSNFIFVATLLAALSYFLFSFELKGKFMTKFNAIGRWMLMIGFGAIFGGTIMSRFALVIDRLSFIWAEWFQALIRMGRA